MTATARTTTARITRIDIRHYQAEIESPVVTSFGSIPARVTSLLRIEDSDGAHGWGEIWGNFPLITSAYRARLAAWVLPDTLLGQPLAAPGVMTGKIADQLRVLKVQAAETGPVEAVLAATNQALWDLQARRQGKPLRHLINRSAPDAVAAYGSGINPDDCVETVERSRREGYRAFKLKIGFGTNVDRRNLLALRSGMEPGERLFVDANQKWTFEEACARFAVLEEAAVDWFEEPMIATAPAAEWQALAAACPVPLAGGENIMDSAALEESIAWFGYVQPDIGKWGGIDGCLAIGRQAIAAGKAYCPHWLSGGVGLMHSAQLLAALGGDGLLEVDTNANPLRTRMIDALPGLRHGRFELGTAPGLGIEPPVSDMTAWLQHHETIA